MKKLISVISGSRADFGLLKEVISGIDKSPILELELIATGSHLSEAFGGTSKEISLAGFTNVVEIGLDLEINSESELTIALSNVIHQVARHYSKKIPSLTLVLGDRYEILGAAVACATLGIPLGHIHGGEITSGSKDDMYRHAITKLASLHFVANSEFQGRVIGMGEDPEKVFVVGGLGVDSISRIKIFSRFELELKLGIRLSPDYALVTYHPDSINPDNSLNQLRIVLNSIERFQGIQFIVTGANADYYGNQFNVLLREMSAQNARIFFFDSLGQQNYLSLLAGAKFVLGNSSSGLLEAPYFKIPTVNVGKRQDGRPRAKSVIDVNCEESEIVIGIERAITDSDSSTLQETDNPYGHPGASERITDILEACEFGGLLPKRFNDGN